MLDKANTEFATQNLAGAVSTIDRQEKQRLDLLKIREGKSATRTVKQAIAMKHSKARRSESED